MFSRYKKSQASSGTPEPAVAAAAAAAQEKPAETVAKRKPVIASRHATAQPMDKEKKRKERLGEIKVELHKHLLDNLNLAALERARNFLVAPPPFGITASVSSPCDSLFWPA